MSIRCFNKIQKYKQCLTKLFFNDIIIELNYEYFVRLTFFQTTI